MSERVSDPLAKYAKRIQSGRDAIAVKRPTAWDVAVVEFADALLDSRARVRELDGDYQRIITEVLRCRPLPAKDRADDQLEPPWKVIARIRGEEGGMSKFDKGFLWGVAFGLAVWALALLF